MSVAQAEIHPKITVALSCTDGIHNKFYLLQLFDGFFEASWGRLGTLTPASKTDYGHEDDLLSKFIDRVISKLKRGYSITNISTLQTAPEIKREFQRIFSVKSYTNEDIANLLILIS